MFCKHARVGNGAVSMYACNDQRELLRSRLLTDNGNSSMETLK